MLAMGFSINVLTMFGMVLAIGILVDDAIIVVENVERIMSEEGLTPKDATRKAMKQITGAVIGITLVLASVFIPMAFFPGAVGVIYRQFSLTMVVSILFSALLALSLTPALCASFLKQVPKGHHHAKRGFFGWFNRSFDQTSHGYSGIVKRPGPPHRSLHDRLHAPSWPASAGCSCKLPSSFLPDEDQGFVIVMMQLPSEATGNRTTEVVEQAEKIFGQEPAVERIIAINGFSFFGTGQNAALAFVTLKDWKERDADNAAQSIAMRATMAMSQIKDAISFALSPPAIQGLGTTGGFSFRLQDRGGLGEAALSQARDQLLGLAAQSKIADRGSLRRHARCGSGQRGHRPRKGQYLRRDLCGHQLDDLDQPRLVLCQRLPECRPHAARDGAGGRGPAHADGGSAEPQRPQRQWRHGAALRLRDGGVGQGLDRRRSATTATRRYASAAKRLRATPPATRSPKCSGLRANCRQASVTNGPASPCRKSSRVPRRLS